MATPLTASSLATARRMFAEDVAMVGTSEYEALALKLLVGKYEDITNAERELASDVMRDALSADDDDLKPGLREWYLYLAGLLRLNLHTGA